MVAIDYELITGAKQLKVSGFDTGAVRFQLLTEGKA
ncbi:hypothetical protein SAMN04488055_0525 [Chitinophaga niabensis]|uniref:Uncharacterized protein n=1 Tax=Chitinophaga niabensis TaxID=536979 RepID=A0A1N6DA25_9BACT|nr:hypothetical protein SAMN04488055_0525 [Chitinophaga niabensis]